MVILNTFMENRKELEEYVYLLETAQQELFKENYNEWKTYVLEKNHKDYLTIDLSFFSEIQIRMILTDTLAGIYFFHFEFTNRKVFQLGAFNEVINSLKGSKEIQIYRKAFPWFRKETLKILSSVVM